MGRIVLPTVFLNFIEKKEKKFIGIQLVTFRLLDVCIGFSLNVSVAVTEQGVRFIGTASLTNNY